MFTTCVHSWFYHPHDNADGGTATIQHAVKAVTDARRLVASRGLDEGTLLRDKLRVCEITFGISHRQHCCNLPGKMGKTGSALLLLPPLSRSYKILCSNFAKVHI